MGYNLNQLEIIIILTVEFRLQDMLTSTTPKKIQFP